jgi:hypothetical protein
MNDEDNTMAFQFSHQDATSGLTMTFEVSDDEQWSEVSRRFRNFLSAVYGYEIPANG